MQQGLALRHDMPESMRACMCKLGHTMGRQLQLLLTLTAAPAATWLRTAVTQASAPFALFWSAA